MAYKMKGFSGFKSKKDNLITIWPSKKPSATKFKMNGKDPFEGKGTKRRAKLSGKHHRASEILRKIGMEETKPKNLSKKPFSKGLDMTLNENLNKAVKGRGPGSPKTLSAKEFLRKNTIKPKTKKPLSRPFGPGTRPLARNVSKALRTFGTRFGAAGVALGLYEGAKAVFKGYGKMGKTKQGRQIIKSGRMQPGKI